MYLSFSNEKQLRVGRTLKLSIVEELFGFACALLHNHPPSGDPEPSKEDRDLTDRLKEAGELIGIDLIEHLVVGSDCYTSFSEMNLL